VRLRIVSAVAVLRNCTSPVNKLRAISRITSDILLFLTVLGFNFRV